MAYLIDANVFIQAKNLHYGFDFCLAFWDWLMEGNAAGRVFSIDKVGDELAAGADELATWSADRGEGFFLPPDDPVFPALTRVSTWATTQGYDPAAVNTFLQVADYWLVAHALAQPLGQERRIDGGGGVEMQSSGHGVRPVEGEGAGEGAGA
mgnify:CR=1 FL=1